MNANCKNCCTKFCTAAGKNDDPDICEEYTPIRTNADRIRAMTDEELADTFAHKADACWNCSADGLDTCKECWLEWLKQEAKENA